MIDCASIEIDSRRDRQIQIFICNGCQNHSSIPWHQVLHAFAMEQQDMTKAGLRHLQAKNESFCLRGNREAIERQ
jgi:hypothetical protein